MIKYGAWLFEYKALPLYDMAFIIAFGFNEGEIASILNDRYNLNITSDIVGYRVRDFLEALKMQEYSFLLIT